MANMKKAAAKKPASKTLTGPAAVAEIQRRTSPAGVKKAEIDAKKATKKKAAPKKKAAKKATKKKAAPRKKAAKKTTKKKAAKKTTKRKAAPKKKAAKKATKKKAAKK